MLAPRRIHWDYVLDGPDDEGQTEECEDIPIENYLPTNLKFYSLCQVLVMEADSNSIEPLVINEK